MKIVLSTFLFVIFSYLQGSVVKNDIGPSVYRAKSRLCSTAILGLGALFAGAQLASSFENRRTLFHNRGINFDKKIKEEYVDDILFRGKIYEGRLNTEAFDNYLVGNKVRWFSDENNYCREVTTKIVDRKVYESFEQMLRDLGHKNFLPRASCLEEAIKIYHSFPDYAAEEKNYGAIAFKLEKENTSAIAKCSIRHEYLEHIISGSKTYEGRIATEFFKTLSPGTIVEWYCQNQKGRVLTKITARKHYASFEEMLLDVGYKKFLPEAKSIEHAVRIYKSIPGYSKKSLVHGVLAFQIKMIDGVI